MSGHIRIPVKTVNNEQWAQLNHFGPNHIFCGEKCTVKDQNYTFAGNHRVRLVSIKNNVHWKIPAGIALDLTDVQPATPPRRHPNR